MSFRFQKFQVYKDAKDFVKVVFESTTRFPSSYQHDLGRQIRNAAISIVLNLAEGSDRGSDKEFNRFIMMSLGSLNEVVAGFDIACDNHLITRQELEGIINKAENLAKQFGGFSKTLKSN